MRFLSLWPRCHAALAAALLLWSCATNAAKAQDAPSLRVVEDPTALEVTIGGKGYALDALIVRRPGGDKLPVALITHGANPGKPREADLSWLRSWAHDLAHRGWLAVAVMRRGYGNSEGEVEDDAGTCTAPHVGRYLDGHADDLEAALQTIARRPDADMSRVLSLGDSAGGAVTLDLAARPSAHISAVVNVSGGLGRRLAPFKPDPACGPYEADLVRNFARFGATTRAPTLWLYAENDGWFRPELIQQLHTAFTGGGGRAELVMLPPFQDDGHKLFFELNGKQVLLPPIDQFLRANGLPTWDPATFSGLLIRLPVIERESVEKYLRMPTEKALALGAKNGAYWAYGERTVLDARLKALALCRQRTGEECSLAAENFSLLK